MLEDFRLAHAVPTLYHLIGMLNLTSFLVLAFWQPIDIKLLIRARESQTIASLPYLKLLQGMCQCFHLKARTLQQFSLLLANSARQKLAEP